MSRDRVTHAIDMRRRPFDYQTCGSTLGRRAPSRPTRYRASLVADGSALNRGTRHPDRPRRAYSPVSVGLAVGALGLVFDIIGVWTLSRGAFMTDDDIARIGTYDDLEGNSRRPAAISLREEGRSGLVVALLGFALPLAGQLLPSTWMMP
jgi:hypothetical protein